MPIIQKKESSFPDGLVVRPDPDIWHGGQVLPLTVAASLLPGPRSPGQRSSGWNITYLQRQQQATMMEITKTAIIPRVTPMMVITTGSFKRHFPLPI